MSEADHVHPPTTGWAIVILPNGSAGDDLRIRVDYPGLDPARLAAFLADALVGVAGKEAVQALMRTLEAMPADA